MKIISASIDLKKVDTTKIIKGKTGARYYPIQIFINDEKDKFGNDVGITDQQTKEQREAKEKKKYIGNGRTVYESNPAPSAPAESEEKFSEKFSDEDDLPF